MDDAAFGANGSVTIELLPDTTGADPEHRRQVRNLRTLGRPHPGGSTVGSRHHCDHQQRHQARHLTIAPASAPEGDTGSAGMTFTVTLAKAVTEAVTVNYATSDGTAVAGQDYTAVSNGSVTIAANTTTRRVHRVRDRG